MTRKTSRQATDEHPLMGHGKGRLQDKVALVTGANSGIGRATARLFAREGAKVVCVDLVEEVVPRVEMLIQSDGGEATFFRGDVTSAGSCETMVKKALDLYGDLDILINNAGAGVRGRVDQLSETDWKRIVELNLTGVFLGAKAALPHMMAKGKGSIVNTASTFGLLGTGDYAVYSASKGAVVLLTRSMAIDYGPFGIRVNCICPGGTATPRLLRILTEGKSPIEAQASLAAAAKINRAIQRLAFPEEIAYGMLFLSSDEASFVTGHALAVDGGQTIDA